ncbi:MAG: hypothetical protein RLZZ231_316 [Bacteroidota bacterium]|jgi:hypothetical protein
MKSKFALLFVLVSCLTFAQQTYDSKDIVKKKTTFTQFDIAVPLKANANYGEIDQFGTRNDYWFLPNGLNAKFGYGIQHQKWVSVSAHAGIEFIGREKLVAVPVFANLRFSPHIGNGNRIVLQAGYGKGYALGRGNLSGKYKKFSISYEADQDTNIFIEVSGYDLPIHNSNSVGSLSIGISLRTF